MTVQVRDLDDDVQQKLREAAKREGMSLSAFLRRELTSLATRLAARERFDKLGERNRLGMSAEFLRNVNIQDVVASIREDRDDR